jgi:hypothetical protein
MHRAVWVGRAALALLRPGAFLGGPGTPMAGAQRYHAGEVCYRDFWTIYAPGSYYLTAGLLALFGRYVLVQALAGVALRALAVGLFFALLRRVGAGARAAAALAGVLALALWELAPEVGTYAGALPAVLLAWLAAASHAGGAPAGRLFLAGLALGIGATFKHDVAAYAWLATAAGLAVVWWRTPPDERPASWESPLRALARLAAGSALVLLPVVALLAWKAGPDAWRDLMTFPAGDFRLVRGEPYPGWLPRRDFLEAWLAEPADLSLARDLGEHLSGWLLASLPQAAFVLALGAVAGLGGRAPRTAAAPQTAPLHRERLLVTTAALVAWPLFFAAAHVQQNTHFLSMALCAFLAGAALWPRLGPWARRLAVALAVVWAPALWIPPAMEAMLPLRVWSGWARLDLPVARGVWVSPREQEIYETVARFVELNLPPGEPIHAGVARNDAVVVSNPRFHYMVDRPAATRYHELHPGITDVEAVQREMIADLEARGVRCLVLWSFGGRERGDADERIVARRRATGIEGIGATLLDEYVAERYRPVLAVDEYTIHWRRDAGEPVLP